MFCCPLPLESRLLLFFRPSPALPSSESDRVDGEGGKQAAEQLQTTLGVTALAEVVLMWTRTVQHGAATEIATQIGARNTS